MRATLQVTLNSGVKITTSREVKVFTDVGQFGRRIMDWCQQIKRIAPDLAADRVESVHVMMDEGTARPRRKRVRSHHAASPAPEAAAAATK